MPSPFYYYQMSIPDSRCYEPIFANNGRYSLLHTDCDLIGIADHHNHNHPELEVTANTDFKSIDFDWTGRIGETNYPCISIQVINMRGIGGVFMRQMTRISQTKV